VVAARKLELVWPQKEGRLLYRKNAKGITEPYFVGPCAIAPRPLIDVEQTGSEKGKRWSPDSNLLIVGDNLVALRSLLDRYEGKIQLVYIDPPFNTGVAFEEYDDGLEHSIWLTMMRDRLEYLWRLLAEDAAIFIEIDDTEVAGLRLLLDDIFGRKNFVTMISVRRSAGTGHKAINPGPINVTEYIVAYAKDKTRWAQRYVPLMIPRAAYDKAYSSFITNRSASYKNWRFSPLAEVVAEHLKFKSAQLARKSMGAAAFQASYVEFALQNAESVNRFAIPNYAGVSGAARTMIDRSKKSNAVLRLERDRYSDMYFHKGQRILFLSDKIHDTDEGGSGIAEKLTNFWEDISWQGIANEGAVQFLKNKKPERLLDRIIRMNTKPGELVLDSFVGSGTTAAVAHKRGRRWIGCELQSDIAQKAIGRMKGVVAGTDRTGISKVAGWTGGGGFRVMAVGDPLLRKDTHGLSVINPSYKNGLLVQAVCAYEGFELTGDPVLHGKKDSVFAHVTEEFVSTPYVEDLMAHLADGARLRVYATHLQTNLEVPSTARVVKIPRDIRRRYCEDSNG